MNTGNKEEGRRELTVDISPLHKLVYSGQWSIDWIMATHLYEGRLLQFFKISLFEKTISQKSIMMANWPSSKTVNSNTK